MAKEEIVNSIVAGVERTCNTNRHPRFIGINKYHRERAGVADAIGEIVRDRLTRFSNEEDLAQISLKRKICTRLIEGDILEKVNDFLLGRASKGFWSCIGINSGVGSKKAKAMFLGSDIVLCIEKAIQPFLKAPILVTSAPILVNLAPRLKKTYVEELFAANGYVSEEESIRR